MFQVENIIKFLNGDRTKDVLVINSTEVSSDLKPWANVIQCPNAKMGIAALSEGKLFDVIFVGDLLDCMEDRKAFIDSVSNCVKDKFCVVFSSTSKSAGQMGYLDIHNLCRHFAVVQRFHEAEADQEAFYLLPKVPSGQQDHWHKRWTSNVTGWHLDNVSTLLETYWDLLVQQGSNEEKVFLFPLCGKSIDLAWVYRQGHKVIGIEVVVEAVSQLFSEASIPYKVQPMDACKGWKYCSHDGRLTVFACDLFAMTRDDLDGELADCVFDRAAYVAVPKSLRRRYAEAITGLCSLNFRCLMITEVYDDKRFDIGPPFCAKLEDLQESFQGSDVTFLEEMDNPVVAQKNGVDKLASRAFLIQPRQSNHPKNIA